MDRQNSQIAPRKKTFWRMVKTMFVPAQTLANLMVGCGRKKGKKRLSMKNMHLAKEAFLRTSFRRSQQQHPLRPSRIESSLNEVDNHPSIIEANAEPVREIISPESLHSYESSNVTLPLPHPTISRISLPAPTNLDEAQNLLESLALNSTSLSLSPLQDLTTDTILPTHSANQLVTVEVEIIKSYDELPSSTPIAETDQDGITDHDTFSISSISTGESNHTHTSNQNETYPLTTFSDSIDDADDINAHASIEMRCKKLSRQSTASEDGDFHGWRKSSVEVSQKPPVTLAFIPSGLLVGDRIVWLNDDHPEIGTVRWIGKIRNQFYAGIEFDRAIGNSSGIYGYGLGLYKRLFTCELSYGRFVPVKELVLYKDYHDTGIKSGIVCVICRDDFLETWEPDTLHASNYSMNERESSSTNNKSDFQLSHMVSTKCGHLYHWGCLDQWFSTKKRTELHCPLCVKPMERHEVIRIFPSQI